MCSLQCFIAIIKCNLYIKIRKTVRAIHLWGIINIVMTSLTAAQTLPNVSWILKQSCFYLRNMFLISRGLSISVFLKWTYHRCFLFRYPKERMGSYEPAYRSFGCIGGMNWHLQRLHPFITISQALPQPNFKGSLAYRSDTNILWWKMHAFILTSMR